MGSLPAVQSKQVICTTHGSWFLVSICTHIKWSFLQLGLLKALLSFLVLTTYRYKGCVAFLELYVSCLPASFKLVQLAQFFA